jgi:proline dehydrogenase
VIGAGVVARRRRAVDPLWDALARLAARRYVVGPELAGALAACDRLAARGLRTVVCRWSAEADRPPLVAERCLAAIDALARSERDTYLAVKAHALGFSRELVLRIVARARPGQIPIHFDAQKHELNDAIWRLVAEAAALSPGAGRIGCTLPGRWRRSRVDAERAAALRLRVRVVKGQNPDPTPGAPSPAAGFLDIVEALAGRAHHVAVASHDAPLVRRSLETLRAAGTPCELELLHGLPFAPALREAMRLEVPVRIYLPYGDPALPYHYSHLRGDYRIVGWLLEDLLFKRPLAVPRWYRPPAPPDAPRRETAA